MLSVLNLMMIACVVAVGLFKADGANWTEGPGFFPYGFGGVREFIFPISAALTKKLKSSPSDPEIIGPASLRPGEMIICP